MYKFASQNIWNKTKWMLTNDRYDLYENHEANIRGGGKTVHDVFKYLFISMLSKGEGGVAPPLSSPPYFPADPWAFHLKTT
jgi:hypothetical protein